MKHDKTRNLYVEEGPSKRPMTASYRRKKQDKRIKFLEGPSKRPMTASYRREKQDKRKRAQEEENVNEGQEVEDEEGVDDFVQHNEGEEEEVEEGVDDFVQHNEGEEEEEGVDDFVQHNEGEEEEEEGDGEEDEIEEENEVEDEVNEEDEDTGEEDEDDEDTGEEDEDDEDSEDDQPLYNGGHDHVCNYLLKKLPEERGILRCKQYNKKIKRWDLEGELEEMKNLVKSSKLYNLVKCSYENVDKVLVSAFIERWHPETNTFHLPFGEMTITLDDVEQLLGLPIIGKEMIELHNVKLHYPSTVESSLGIPQSEVNAEMKACKTSYVRTRWLIDQLSYNSAHRQDVTPEQAARGYLLLVLGCTIFQDKTGNKVDLKYLQYLDNMNEVDDWAWGAGCLAHLYRMLGKASNFQTSTVSGYLTLLQAWVYEHFKSLRPGCPCDLSPGMQRTEKWISKSGLYEEAARQHLQFLRCQLDYLKKHDVDWSPYRPRLANLPDVVWFYGCLVIDKVREPYHPNRVVWQFGLVQDNPCSPIVRVMSKRKKKNQPEPEAIFEDYTSHLVPLEDRGTLARSKIGGLSTKKYDRWYTSKAIVKLSGDLPEIMFVEKKVKEVPSFEEANKKAVQIVEGYKQKGIKHTKKEMDNIFTSVLDVLLKASYSTGTEVGESSKSVEKKRKANN